MQPTPTSEPVFTFVTLGPNRSTRSTISWPGTMGSKDRPHSPRAW